MSFNLLTDPFLPVRTAADTTRVLRLAELPFTQDAIEPDWPRADFNAATMELLIGLAALALQPCDDDDWAEVWEDGPQNWGEKLAALAPSFELLGDGPRFLQEFGGLTGDLVPIEALLIDTPGANGQKKNADLLTHRARYPALSLSAAAMALYTLQAYAPAGGAGNQTSMRGGGPLSTFLIPQPVEGGSPISLWQKVWANVLPTLPVEDLTTVCAWLRPQVAAGKIHQGDPRFHQLHCFFGMPRRLHLVTAEGTCAMTGQTGTVITHFVQKPKGLDYGLWEHPLTPYRRQKEDAEPYTAKPSSARFRAADWIAAVLGDPPLRQPAAVVTNLSSRLGDFCPTGTEPVPQLRVSGWNMNNMEATDWLASEEPLYITGDAVRDEAVAQFARLIARAADEAAGQTVSAVKRALFAEAKVDTGKGVLSMIRSEILDDADSGFHDQMARAVSGHDLGALRSGWHLWLRQISLSAFDKAAPVPIADPEKARAVVTGRNSLLRAFGPKTKASSLKALLPETT